MQYQDYNHTHLNANAATIINAYPGFLGSVIINTKGATANTATIADGTTTIAVIDTTSTVGTLEYNIRCATSLVVTLASGTAADITVTWK